MADKPMFTDDEALNKKALEYIDTTGREQTSLPTIEGLAIYLDCNDDTVNEYAHKSEFPKFSATVKKIKMLQKDQLVNDGLYGGKEVNQAMAIFLLKANHNMVEYNGVVVGGEVKDDGTRENGIYLYASGGFLPPNIALPATSTGSVGNTAAPESSTIQGTNLAPESEKNLHGNQRDIQTGTP